MSAVRELLANAASTVEGVNVSPYFRQTSRAGDGYVRLDLVNYPQNGFGGVNTWQVLLVLPNDLASAEKWIESKLSGLVSAIAEQLIVTSAQPIQLVVDNGTIPALAITGHRESE